MNAQKPRIVADSLLRELARVHGTPLYVYDASPIETRMRELDGFDVVRYAQKANSSLALLALLRRHGACVDAVSAGEIARALAAGFAPSEILFTADLFEHDALRAVAAHDVAVSLGSEDMLAMYAREVSASRASGRDREITLRVNPGFGHGHDRRVSTGGETSKHGIWHADLPRAVARARELGLCVRGLHIHIGSGSDFEHLARVCAAMQSSVRIVADTVRTISAGGGLPIPYRASDTRIDVAAFTDLWLTTRAAIEEELGRKITLEVEPGRYLVAEAGLLLCEVRGTKRSGSIDYALVDAGFHNLVRPALYGAYHQITAVGRTREDHVHPTVVAGPLCESSDVFTQDRDGNLDPAWLPKLSPGDLLCVHDTGAYASSMASNYNSHPLAAEVLVEGGEHRVIRRRQTIAELLANERDGAD